jgi:hypothetical protein
MVFNDKTALLVQAKLDKMPIRILRWCEAQTTLAAITESMTSNWRAWCIAKGYEDFARMAADLAALGDSERILQTAVRVTAVEEGGGGGGEPGESAYCYIGYASDDEGADFTLTFDPALNYIAILSTTEELSPPVVGDFAGLWKNYKGATGAAGAQGEPGAKGDTGDTGATGAQGAKGCQWRGDWDIGTAYVVDDVARHPGDGKAYICIQANTGQDPQGAPAYWSVFCGV